MGSTLHSGPALARSTARTGAQWPGTVCYRKASNSAIFLMPAGMSMAIFVNSVPRAHLIDLGSGATIKHDPDTHLNKVADAIRNSVQFLF